MSRPVNMCADWRSCHLVFRLLFVFIALCLYGIVHLHTFAPQLGNFYVVLCFVTFSAHFSPNRSLADNSVVSRSACVCESLFTLSKLAFDRNQIDSGESQRKQKNQQQPTAISLMQFYCCSTNRAHDCLVLLLFEYCGHIPKTLMRYINKTE